MIVYGTGSTNLKVEELPNAVCPNCETKGSLMMNVISRHADIFWIPLFPFGKTGIVECTNCKHVIEKKQMSDELKKEYSDIKSDTKPKIWQFSGLIIIMGLAF